MAKFRDIKPCRSSPPSHASIHNHFNQERHLSCRDIFKQSRVAAMAEWHHLAARTPQTCTLRRPVPVCLTVPLPPLVQYRAE